MLMMYSRGLKKKRFLLSTTTTAIITITRVIMTTIWYALLLTLHVLNLQNYISLGAEILIMCKRKHIPNKCMVPRFEIQFVCNISTFFTDFISWNHAFVRNMFSLVQNYTCPYTNFPNCIYTAAWVTCHTQRYRFRGFGFPFRGHL